jgi:hypothetical protein
MSITVFRRLRLALLGGIATLATTTHAAAEPEIVAAGLNNPRGLAFGPGARLYVAESGHGGDGVCKPNPEPNGADRCFGETGALVRVDPWHGKDPATSWQRVVTGLPSLAAQIDNPATPIDESGSRAIGPVDVAFVGANPYLLMAWGGDPAKRSVDFGEPGKTFGTILDIDLKSAPGWGHDRKGQPRWRVVADIAAHELAQNPDAAFNPLPPDSNPNGLLASPFRFLVADAGGNSVVEATPWGRTRTFAVFGPRCIALAPGIPPGPGPGSAAGCAAGQWSVQSVPTTVERGPDWAIYTGELTGFPFPPGGARVLRSSPWGGDAATALEGFTNVIDIAFDHWGNAYVLEIAQRVPPLGPAAGGRLVKVDRRTGDHEELARGLLFPGGVAIGPDGAAYVTEGSAFKGIGRVLRVPLR